LGAKYIKRGQANILFEAMVQQTLQALAVAVFIIIVVAGFY